MKNKTTISMAFALSILTLSVAQAGTEAISTSEMLPICTATDGSEITCEIYAQAVYDTYTIMVRQESLKESVCVNQPAPSRKEVIQSYASWVKAPEQEPLLMDQPAALTMLQFMREMFPC